MRARLARLAKVCRLVVAVVLAESSIPTLQAWGSSSAAPAHLRYCGEAPEMIANSVHGSYGVRCSLARRLIKDLLGGSHARYPRGYTARPKCYIAGFYCHYGRERPNGASEGLCAKGRLRVVGVAGP